MYFTDTIKMRGRTVIEDYDVEEEGDVEEGAGGLHRVETLGGRPAQQQQAAAAAAARP